MHVQAVFFGWLVLFGIWLGSTWARFGFSWVSDIHWAAAIALALTAAFYVGVLLPSFAILQWLCPTAGRVLFVVVSLLLSLMLAFLWAARRPPSSLDHFVQFYLPLFFNLGAAAVVVGFAYPRRRLTRRCS